MVSTSAGAGWQIGERRRRGAGGSAEGPWGKSFPCLSGTATGKAIVLERRKMGGDALYSIKNGNSEKRTKNFAAHEECPRSARHAKATKPPLWSIRFR